MAVTSAGLRAEENTGRQGRAFANRNSSCIVAPPDSPQPLHTADAACVTRIDLASLAVVVAVVGPARRRNHWTSGQTSAKRASASCIKALPVSLPLLMPSKDVARIVRTDVAGRVAVAG